MPSNILAFPKSVRHSRKVFPALMAQELIDNEELREQRRAFVRRLGTFLIDGALWVVVLALIGVM